MYKVHAWSTRDKQWYNYEVPATIHPWENVSVHAFITEGTADEHYSNVVYRIQTDTLYYNVGLTQLPNEEQPFIFIEVWGDMAELVIEHLHSGWFPVYMRDAIGKISRVWEVESGR